MKRPAPPIAWLGLGVALVGCNERVVNLPTPEEDLIPPSAVSDLELDSRAANSVVLRWTAPGDDGAEGVAWRYDLRWADDPITDQTWGSARQIGGEPPPGFPGWVQVFEVIRLEEGHTYFFALRTIDDRSNGSELSNVLEVVPRSVHDLEPPAVVTDLAATVLEGTRVRLSWTAPGDDGDVGTAQGYEIRYATAPLNSSNFRTGRAILEAPVPVLAGGREILEVSGLSPGTVYYFGLRAWDEAANVSALSNVVSFATRS